MKKRMAIFLLAGALAAGSLTGCQSGQTKASTKETTSSVRLDPNNPVSLTVWHYYNGAQQAAFDALVSDFNATEGKEQGVYVEGYSQGSVADLEKAVSDAAAVAERYYAWTDAQTPDVPDDGKAFYGRDSMSNYFVIGMKQMGIDIFDVQDGKVTIRADEDAIRRLWDNYYVPFVNGYFASSGKFRSDDVKTGDVLAYTGSSSSATYFPDQVVLDDETRPINYAILPVPVMEGGDQVNVQQGAGMAVTKSDEQHEYAASVFLKWFTAKENNLRFVCESAYLPVRKDANSIEALDEVIQANDLTVSDKAYDCLVRVLEQYDTKDFYATKCFENGYAARKVLDYNLSDKAAEDRAQVVAQMEAGASREEAVAPYVTEEAFQAWYASFVQALQEAAQQ